jgi:hypothetical protein
VLDPPSDFEPEDFPSVLADFPSLLVSDLASDFVSVLEDASDELLEDFSASRAFLRDSDG